MIDLYVGFHAPIPLRDWRRDWTMLFGHVEAWWRSEDGTWVFFDPQGRCATITVEHRFEEVDLLVAARFLTCAEIYRVPFERRQVRFPLHLTMTCASQVAHLLGDRASTPWGLRRILRSRQAEALHDSERGPSGQGRARA